MEKVGNGTIGGYLLSFIGRFFEETHTKEGYGFITVGQFMAESEAIWKCAR